MESLSERGYLWCLRTLFPSRVKTWWQTGDWHILADRTGSCGSGSKSRILVDFRWLSVLPGLCPPAGSQVQSEGKCILTGNNVLKDHRYHPRHDGKSVQGIENRRVRGAPLRKRVRNYMKMLGLQGCDRKETS